MIHYSSCRYKQNYNLTKHSFTSSSTSPSVYYTNQHHHHYHQHHHHQICIHYNIYKKYHIISNQMRRKMPITCMHDIIKKTYTIILQASSCFLIPLLTHPLIHSFITPSVNPSEVIYLLPSIH